MYYMADLPKFSPTLIEVVEKRYSIIQCYLSKELKVKDILEKYGVTKPDFYKYLNRFKEYGKVGLQNMKRGAKVPHNKTPSKVEEKIISLHHKYPFFNSCEIKELESIEKELEAVDPRTIHRIHKKHGLKKVYKPKREKKTILEKLKKEFQRKRRGRKKSPSQRRH